MIDYTKYELENGLRLLVHQDKSTPLVSVCMTYNVGTKDEQPDKTGYAHLFEHLMFGGSKNAPSFDDYIQKAGGENNAFTNQDMTVYYEYLPCQNLEIALWLEADRMFQLNLNQKTLERERKVVVEEFKEHCIEEPYGDIWHHLGPLVYKKHPYQIPTIGKTPEHIKKAQLTDIIDFYKHFYCPNNAVLTVSGNVEPKLVLKLTKKWFGDIERGNPTKPTISQEPPQTEKRTLHVEANAPVNAIYMVFQASERYDDKYFIDDFITDVLAEGDTAQLYKNLVKEQELFSNLDAYITGTVDKGLMVVEGKLADGVSFETAEKAIWEELKQLQTNLLSKQDIEKFQNNIEHNLEFSEINHLHKAINLGYYELLGNAAWINEESHKYNAITAKDIQKRSLEIFQESGCSVMYYKAKKTQDSH